MPRTKKTYKKKRVTHKRKAPQRRKPTTRSSRSGKNSQGYFSQGFGAAAKAIGTSLGTLGVARGLAHVGGFGGIYDSAGAMLGAGYGALRNYISGMGDYKFSRNSFTADGMGGLAQVPQMHSMKDGVRVRHREYIQDISSSVAFTNTSFSLNPGLDATFPWLAALAQNFEEYRFEGLVVEFKSTSADALNSTNTALGTIVIAAEYNTTAAAYINKQQMENSMWCVSSKPSECLIMPIECAPQFNPLANQYIRTTAVASGQDIRLYDIANFQVATVGSQAAAVIGELWLSYDVVLLKPQVSVTLDLAGETAHYQLTAPVVTTAYFGTAQTQKIDNIGLTLTGTVLTFPIASAGKWLLSYSVTGDATALTSPTFTYSSNITEVNAWKGNANPAISNGSSTSINYIRNWVVNIADPTLTSTITLSVGTLPANPTSGDLVVTQIPSNYV